MNNYLDILKTIYCKDKLALVEENWQITMLMKTLIKESSNLPKFKIIEDYLYYVNPKHLFYLLYFIINKRSYIPRTPKFDKPQELTPKKQEFQDTILKYLDWNERDLKDNKVLFDTLVTNNKKEWDNYLGI